MLSGQLDLKIWGRDLVCRYKSDSLKNRAGWGYQENAEEKRSRAVQHSGEIKKEEIKQCSLGVRRETKGAVSGQQVSRRRERPNMSAGYRSDKLGTENRQLDLQFEGYWWSR